MGYLIVSSLSIPRHILVEIFGANAYLGVQTDILHVVIFAGLMQLSNLPIPRLHSVSLPHWIRSRDTPKVIQTSSFIKKPAKLSLYVGSQASLLTSLCIIYMSYKKELSFFKVHLYRLQALQHVNA